MNLNPFLNSIIIIGITIGVLILSKIILHYVINYTKKTKSKLADIVVQVIVKPLNFAIFFIGIHLALSQMPYISNFIFHLNKVFTFFYTVIGIMFLQALVSIVLNWCKISLLQNKNIDFDENIFNLVKKIVTIIIWLVIALIVLDQLGIKITPLLTSLGIGGLAIGLALQDTFANFFSGIYISADKPFRIGDNVKLDSGEEGCIVEIGWRTTRIKLFNNNIVVVPNLKISQSKLINYSLPEETFILILPLGVSYKSDLNFVEKITLEVAEEMQKNMDEIIKDFKPLIRYNSFGDSNINFNLILKTKDFTSQYLVKHQLIKKIFERYKKENIEIAYPTRSVEIIKPFTSL